MATFLVRWSEGDGDPRIVVAVDFGEAVDRFVKWVQDTTEAPDDVPAREQVLTWIERIDRLSDDNPIFQ